MLDENCPFCEIGSERVVAARPEVIAVRDAFPVSRGHTLVIPRRHVSSWFEATLDERLAVLQMLDELKVRLDEEFHPDGYNIGINVGRAAGQTVMHLHVHLIPRFHGDIDDPAGGVRYVIPSRGNYRRPGSWPTVP